MEDDRLRFRSTYIIEDNQLRCPSTFVVADGEKQAVVIESWNQLLKKEYQ